MSKNLKNRWKLMKKANIDWDSLHIFYKTWGISMRFSGKKWHMSHNPLFRRYIFGKTTEPHHSRGEGGSNWPPASLGLNQHIMIKMSVKG